MTKPKSPFGECGVCGLSKPVSDFYVRNDRPLGRTSVCKACHRSQMREISRAPNPTVYGLVDPSNGHLFYVGSTTRTIQRRTYDHQQKSSSVGAAPTIQALLEKGLDVIPIVIQELDADCGPDELAKIEDGWIRYFIGLGCPLTNRRSPITCKPVIDLTTGISYPSISAAAEAVNTHVYQISKVCNGTKHYLTARGHRFAWA